MIHYSKSWGGLSVLFRFTGTAWPNGVWPGAIAVVLCLVLEMVSPADDIIRDREDFVSHPYAFQLFAYMLGFLMVFRTNFAYARYWEAMGHIQAMGAKWLDGALMGICFDAGGDNKQHLLHGMFDDVSLEPHPKTGEKGGPVHSVFAQDMCHLCSLMHALALMHLRGDSDLSNLGTARDSTGNVIQLRQSYTSEGGDYKSKFGLAIYNQAHIAQVYKKQRLRVLGGLNESERKALELKCNGKQFSTEARVAMVESWFMRRLIARQKFEQGESASTSPPILSRLYQVISDGALWFSHASKVASTPFPFPYHNLTEICLWTYTFCVPFLVNGLVMNTIARCAIAFVAVFSYHSLAKVGDNLEDPYTPYDPNELPLPEIQDSFNKRLLMFGVVPPSSDAVPVCPEPTKPAAQENGSSCFQENGTKPKDAGDGKVSGATIPEETRVSTPVASQKMKIVASSPVGKQTDQI